MLKERNRFESVEYDVLQIALGLLEAGVASSSDLPQPGDNIAENLLYWMTFSPKLMFKNPMGAFKARAEAGDFNPLCEDEDPNNLVPGREPMDDDEFAAAKAAVIKAAAIWNCQPEASLATLWLNAWQAARIELCRAENEAAVVAAVAAADKVYGDNMSVASALRRSAFGEEALESVSQEPDGFGVPERDEETYI